MQRIGDQHQVDVWERVDDIDARAWDSVRENADLYSDLRLLRVVEESMSSLARLRFLMIRDPQGRPVLITPLTNYTVDGTVLATDRIYRQSMKLLGRVAPSVIQSRTLLCGLPFSSAQSQLRIAPHADLNAVLPVLDAALLKIARKDRVQSIVLKEFDPETTARLGGLIALGYRQIDSLPVNMLQFDTGDYDEYLAQLSKKKRTEVRRCGRRLASQNLRMVTTSDTALILRYLDEHAYRLYLQVVEQSDTVFEVLPLQFFREIAARLPDNSEFMFCLDENDRVHAFSCSLCFDDTYQGLFCGIDYARDRDAEIYFNILFRLVEDAIARGATTAVIGQNADACKNWKLGTWQTPLSCFVKGVDWLTRTEMRLLGSLLFPPRPPQFPRHTADPATPSSGDSPETAACPSPAAGQHEATTSLAPNHVTPSTFGGTKQLADSASPATR